MLEFRMTPEMGSGITIKQLDQIGTTYLEHILQLDEDTIETFLSGESDQVIDQVGKKHVQVQPLNESDNREFYAKVNEILPSYYSQASLSYYESQGMLGITALMMDLQPPLKVRSPVFRKIRIAEQGQ